MRSAPQAAPNPVIVSLRWTAIEEIGREKPLELIAYDWIGWAIQSPKDWAPLIHGLDNRAWPTPFSLQEPVSRDASPWEAFRRADGASPPILEIDESHGVGLLAIHLRADGPIPREWSDEWNESLWSALEADGPALERLFQGLSPLSLGRRPAQGRTHWSNRAQTDAQRWLAGFEAQALGAIPSGFRAGPKGL